MRTIYLDYNATTPLDSEVLSAMLPFLSEIWGNPSSTHHVGRPARAALDDARERLAHVLSCKPSELVFTSGGTESANLAILGAARSLKARGRHLITSSIEHHAVLHAFQYLSEQEGFTLTILPADAEGTVSPGTLKDALRPDTILVSVMAANNEVGTVQPIAELGSICQKRGVSFHTDAAQWFGKEPFATITQFNADLVSLCAHKFHGPKGAGLLYVRSPLKLAPILHGGTHEQERRAGTENLPAIQGLTTALERFIRNPVFDTPLLRALSEKLRRAAHDIQGLHFVGSASNRLPNTTAFVVERAESTSLLAALDLEGICASSGSACSSGSMKPSHVIKAMGLPKNLHTTLLRLSLGRDTTISDIEHVISILPETIRRVQVGQKHMSPL